MTIIIYSSFFPNLGSSVLEDFTISPHRGCRVDRLVISPQFAEKLKVQKLTEWIEVFVLIWAFGCLYISQLRPHISLPIVMEFWINVHGTKVKQRISKYVFFSFGLKMAVVKWVYWTPWPFLMKFGFCRWLCFETRVRNFVCLYLSREGPHAFTDWDEILSQRTWYKSRVTYV